MSRYACFAPAYARAVLPRLRTLFHRGRHSAAVLDPETLPDYLKRDIGFTDGRTAPLRALWD
jgi:hypothetical protein